jgi:FAD:protein FMN transferase
MVGFPKLQWSSPHLKLPAGMEVDFGGVGKEYAVDRPYELLATRHSAPFLINFGGVRDGIRYGHILDPRTGWPVPSSPRSVTVAASSCTEAGLLSTLALLHGAGAERFLKDEGVRYWILK